MAHELLIQKLMLKATGLALVGTAFVTPNARAQERSNVPPPAPTAATDTVERTSGGDQDIRIVVRGMPEKESGLKSKFLFIPRRISDGFGFLWGETEVGLERGLHIKLPPGTEYSECHGPGEGCRSSRIDLMSDAEIEKLLRDGNITGIVNWQKEAPTGDSNAAEKARIAAIEARVHPDHPNTIDTLSLPVVDSWHPNMKQVVVLLNFAEQHKGQIDQHCKSGVGRTAVGDVLLQVFYDGRTLKEALNDPHNHLMPNQKRFIMKVMKKALKGELMIRVHPDGSREWVQVKPQK
jgi:hypothetical protein